MKVCSNCGKDNVDDAKFCRKCGHQFGGTKDDDSPQSSGQNDNSTIKKILGLVCFVGAIACIVAYWNGAPRYPTIWILIACVGGISWAARD